MTNEELNPPRWAEALLRSLVRPSDRESISGDLLEEYRLSARQARGAHRANVWYIRQVLSVFWRVIRPCVLTLVLTQVLFGVLLANQPLEGRMFRAAKSLWYLSPVQAPGLSLFDALIYVWAGYLGARRTRLVTTGLLAGAATSFVGFVALFAAIAVGTPGLLLVLAPFTKPFILVILSVLLSMAVGYAALAGTLGGVLACGWRHPNAGTFERLEKAQRAKIDLASITWTPLV